MHGMPPPLASFTRESSMNVDVDSLPDADVLVRLTEEFHQRLAAGEDVSVEDFSQQYAHLAPQLRSYIATMRWLDSAAREIDTQAESGAGLQDTDASTDRNGDAGPPGAGSTRLEGRHIGDYRLIEEIARGGMGVVYRARQTSLDRTVALKLILSDQTVPRANRRERFRSEAKAAARLDHPGIVTVYEVGEVDGQPFYSMAFVEGISLAERVAVSPISNRNAAKLMRTVCDAIDYSHGQGIIHRDLKPSNILLDCEGRPRVTDFGLAKLVQSGSDLTQDGQIVGSPGYMSPEQARGEIKEAEPTLDVYSLGAVLYAMLTGRPPFQSDTLLGTLHQVIHDDPVAPRELNPRIAVDLETICLKCLEKDRSRRYQSAREMGCELERFLAGRPIKARPTGLLFRGLKFVKRYPAFCGLMMLTMVCLLALSVFSGLYAAKQQELLVAEQAHARKIAIEKDKASDALKESWQLGARSTYAQALTYLQTTDFQHGIELMQKAQHLASLAADSSLQGSIGLSLEAWNRGVPKLHFSVETAQTVRTSIGPNDRLLAVNTGNDSGDVDVHDMLRNKKVCSLPHPSWVSGMRFHPDAHARLLLTGCGDGLARLWDVDTGKLVHAGFTHCPSPEQTIESPKPDPIIEAFFTSTGDQVVTIGRLGTLRMWDTMSGKQHWSWDGMSLPFASPGMRLGSVAITPTRSHVFAVTLDRMLHRSHLLRWDLCRRHVDVLEIEDRQAIPTLITPLGADELIGCNGADGTASRWRISADSKLTQLERFQLGGRVNSLKTTGTRNWLVAGAQDSRLKFRNLNIGSLELPPILHPGSVKQVSVSPSGRLVASSAYDAPICVWQIGERLLEHHLTSPVAVTSAAWLPDSSRIACAWSQRPNALTIFDVKTGQLMEVGKIAWPEDRQRGFQIASLRSSRDGGNLFALLTNGNIIRFDVAEQQIAAEFYAQMGTRRMAVSRDATHVSVTGNLLPPNNFPVHIYDTKRQEKLAEIVCHNFVAEPYLSDDGSRLLIGSRDGWIRWHRSRDGGVTDEIRLDAPISSLCLSPDRCQLAVGCVDGRIIRLSSDDFSTLGTIMQHDGSVEHIAYTSDSNFLVSCSTDRTARVWEPTTGIEIGPRFLHDSIVREVHPSPDGRQVMTIADDGGVAIWKSPIQTHTTSE